MPRAAQRDAIALLKADHRKIEALFTGFESTRAAPRRRLLAAQICMELRLHIQIEEDTFYPACKAALPARLLRETHLDHDRVRVLIAEIEAGDPADRFYDGKVRVLCEMVENHIEEEEGVLFGQALKAGLDMQALADRMTVEKARLLAAYQGGASPPQTSTVTAAAAR
jgi:hemerythrin superfamily protein